MDYLCITSEENWKICEKHGVWGVKDKNEFGTTRNETIIKKVKENDGLLIYVKTPVKAIVALFEARSKSYYDSNPMWPDGKYQMRIKIGPKSPISKIPYPKVVSGVLKKSNGNAICRSLDLHAEMIPLQKDSVTKLLGTQQGF